MSSPDPLSANASRPIAALDCIEALLSRENGDILFATSKRSPLLELLEARVSSEKRLLLEITGEHAFFSNDRELIASSEFVNEIKKRGISTCLLSNRATTSFIDRMAENGISVIAVSPKLREQFEDKRFFHEFLTRYLLPSPNGRIIESERDLDAPELYPGVLQLPQGQSGVGTFMVNSSTEAISVLRDHDLPYPLLLREFVEGEPYGVTLLVGAKNTAISAVRKQCALTVRGNPYYFCGVQWIPYNALSPNAVQNLEHSLAELSNALRKEGFQGIANIDFMLKGDECLFLECNPRFSGATWQLAWKRELLHELSFLEEYIQTLIGTGPSKNKISLPPSSYEGSTMDFDWLLEERGIKRAQRSGHLLSGVYPFSGESLGNPSVHLEKMDDEEAFLLIPGARPGETYDIRTGIGIALSHLPLYEYEGTAPRLNQRGIFLRDHVSELLL